jgi:hypothetical protein
VFAELCELPPGRLNLNDFGSILIAKLPRIMIDYCVVKGRDSNATIKHTIFRRFEFRPGELPSGRQYENAALGCTAANRHY